MNIQTDITNLENEIFNCVKCERLRSVSPTPWPHVYFGNIDDLSLMVVMRNPGLENDPNKIGLQEFKDNYKDLWLRCRVGKYLLENLGKNIVMHSMFFCNICKCSSPDNSALERNEINNCCDYLKRQIEIIKPKVILAFGMPAQQTVADMDLNIPVEKFYHPSYLSRMPRHFSKCQSEKINIIIKEYNI